jgi:hypothetical protein
MLGVRRRNLLLVSLLFVVLFTSLFVYILTTDDKKSSLEGVMYVKTESELKSAVNNTSQNASVIIAFNKDIILTEPLIIPANRDITLTSNRAKFFKLMGAPNVDTIIVDSLGVVRLEGIIVTHDRKAEGRGVFVKYSGTFTLSDGEISGNIAGSGGGVYIEGGTFSMLGGAIVSNTARLGGGVNVRGGNFSMVSGVISGNTGEGGVYVDGGCFELSGDGVITNNNRGVSNRGGTFIMFGGTISGNTCGVFNVGDFIMSGGVIANSTSDGGVLNLHTFSISGNSIIANNTATQGGGVCSYGSFVMSGGKILGNTATAQGGGVYNDGNFTISGGIISRNTSQGSGGGVFSLRSGFKVLSGGSLISDNKAEEGNDNVHLIDYHVVTAC